MTVDVRFTKWGGRRHWECALEPLGEDRHGTWLGGREGTSMRRGDGTLFPQGHDFVMLVPVEGDWICSVNAPTGNTSIAVYIDITDRPRIADGVVHAVDLDLDVARLWDGSVVVLDEDEFAEHQVRYGYPPDVVAAARATCDELSARLTAGVQPFEIAARHRLEAWAAGR
jgi:predicted RNA-binding protein associated with RNAse of E/G family